MDVSSGLSWPLLARELGLALTQDALPALIGCPWCREPRLHVYCTRDGGTWHTCRGCHRSGDSIDLACGYLGLDWDGAVDHLVTAGLLERDDRRTAYWLQRRHQHERFQELWRRASSAGAGTRSALGAVSRLTVNVADRDWNDLVGPHCGACTYQDIVRALDPWINVGSSSKGFKRRGNHRFGKYHMPRKSVHAKSLVLPFWWHPGRLAGLLCVGAAATGAGGTDNPDNLCFARAGRRIYPQDDAYADVGLYGLDAAAREEDFHTRDVFVFSDPYLAMLMQLRHAATGAGPLPVVAWYHNRYAGLITGAASWDALLGRPLVHWSATVSPQLLYTLVHAGGRLHLGGTGDNGSREAVRKWLANWLPADRLAIVKQEARPWPEAVAAWAARVDDVVLHNLWKQAEALGVPPAAVSQLPVPLARRLSDLLDGEGRCFFYHPRRAIFEHNGQTLRVRRSTAAVLNDDALLLDGILRLDHICPDKNGGEVYYGRLVHRGTVYPFVANAASVRDNFSRWLSAFCVSEHLYVHCHPWFASRAVEYALRMRPPLRVTRAAAKKAQNAAQEARSAPKTSPKPAEENMAS